MITLYSLHDQKLKKSFEQKESSYIVNTFKEIRYNVQEIFNYIIDNYYDDADFILNKLKSYDASIKEIFKDCVCACGELLTRVSEEINNLKNQLKELVEKRDALEDSLEKTKSEALRTLLREEIERAYKLHELYERELGALIDFSSTGNIYNIATFKHLLYFLKNDLRVVEGLRLAIEKKLEELEKEWSSLLNTALCVPKKEEA